MTASASDQLAAHDEVARVLADAPDRKTLYTAIADALQGLVGHKLFTLLAVLPDGEEVQRFYSSNETAYPLTGRKRVGPTHWGEVVLKGRQPWLGRDSAAIRWAFADHELIASLGLGSVINIPVIRAGTLLGTMNLLHGEHHFAEDAMPVVGRFAPYLVSAFAEEIDAIRMG